MSRQGSYCLNSEVAHTRVSNVDEIAGKGLAVLERICLGDCLRWVDTKGLVIVEHIDVAQFRLMAASSDL